MGLFLEANIADNFMFKGVLKMPFRFLGGEYGLLTLLFLRGL